jgi:TolB protein
MRHVARVALGAGVLVLLVAAGLAMGAAQSGPRLAIVRLAAKPFRIELSTITPNGGDAVRLVGGGRGSRPQLNPFSAIAWSPNGERLAFSGIVGTKPGDNHEPIQEIFTARAEGGGLRAIPGTDGGTGPVFAPDGRTLAFTRSVDRDTPTTVGGKRWEHGFRGASIWIVDLRAGRPRQLTPWRDGVSYVASSFSPDGEMLLASHEDDRTLGESEPVALRVDGSGSQRLLEDGESPVYSPAGSEIALVRRTLEYGSGRREGSDLYVLSTDGSDVRRITHTPGAERFPSWDPSGQRLAYVRFSAAQTEAAAMGVGDTLMEVNADGSCPTRVSSAPRVGLYAPAWRPGPERGAGRIGC